MSINRRKAGGADGGAGDIEREVSTVLSGQRPPTARRLFELIHEVNPTGEDLSARQSGARYALKARLQSLLVRRFRSELRVVADRSHEGVVGLQHAVLGSNACHAVVSTLDDDARSWVQLQLDLESSPEGPTASAKSASSTAGSASNPERAAIDGSAAGEVSPHELIRAGKQAAQEFDFEVARTRLSLAFQRTDGATEAALPLLELLVDQLAADREALDLQPDLAPDAEQHPAVRTLLATGAARLGDSQKALGLIQGVDSPRVADVLAGLASNALGKGELEQARGFLDEMSRRRMVHPERVHLDEQLRAKREEVRRPLEEELRGLQDRRNWDEAKPLAQTILQKWPESRLARNVLQEIEVVRRAEAATAMVIQADDALRSRDFSRAARLYREASTLDPELPSILDKVKAAETVVHQHQREAAERAENEEVARTVELLVQEDPKPGLIAYAALEEDVRRRIRAASSYPLLECLEEVGPLRGNAQTQAAVLGILALRDARQEVLQNQAEAALKVIATHQSTLRSVKLAGQVVAEARHALKESIRAKAEAALGTAERLQALGDREGALNALVTVDAGSLTSELRLAIEGIRTRVEHEHVARQLTSRFEGARARGALVEARQIAAQLLEVSEGAERTRWSALSLQLGAEIRRDWRVSASDVSGAEMQVPDFIFRPSDRDRPNIWVAEDTGELFLVTVQGCWVFIRAVALEEHRTKRIAWLRTPEPLTDPTIQVQDSSLWLVGTNGWVLEIDRSSWDILQWHSLRSLFEGNPLIAYMAPGSRHLWVSVRVGDTNSTMLVDAKSWCASRSIAASGGFKPILAADRPIVVVWGPNDGDLSIRTADGRSRRASARLLSVALQSSPQEGTAPKQVVEVGRQLNPYVIEAELTGRTFFLLPDRVRQTLFLSKAVSGEIAAVDVRLPADALLVRSSSEKRVLTLARSDYGFDTCDIGCEWPEPAMPGRTHSWEEEERALEPLLPSCNPIAPGPRKTRVDAPAVEESLIMLPEEVLKLHDRAKEGLNLAVEGFRNSYLANERAEMECAEAMRSKEPDMVDIWMAAALFAAKGQWDELENVLSLAGQPRTPPLRHILHLVGVTLMRCGQTEAAVRAWQRGLLFDDDICDLQLCIALAGQLPAAPTPTNWAPDQPPRNQLLGAIEAADRCLSRGDALAAVKALERWAVFEADELQSAARLAEAHLQYSGAEPEERFRRAIALTYFLGLRASEARRWNVPLGNAAWDDARVDDVARRASEWLEAVEPSVPS